MHCPPEKRYLRIIDHTWGSEEPTRCFSVVRNFLRLLTVGGGVFRINVNFRDQTGQLLKTSLREEIQRQVTDKRQYCVRRG